MANLNIKSISGVTAIPVNNEVNGYSGHAVFVRGSLSYNSIDISRH